MKVGSKDSRNDPDQLRDEDAAWVRRYLRLADEAVRETPQRPRIFSMKYADLAGYVGRGGTQRAAAPPHHAARTAEQEFKPSVSGELHKRRKAG